MSQRDTVINIMRFLIRQYQVLIPDDSLFYRTQRLGIPDRVVYRLLKEHHFDWRLTALGKAWLYYPPKASSRQGVPTSTSETHRSR
jgi:hypothetical protein